MTVKELKEKLNNLTDEDLVIKIKEGCLIIGDKIIYDSEVEK